MDRCSKITAEGAIEKHDASESASSGVSTEPKNVFGHTEFAGDLEEKHARTVNINLQDEEAGATPDDFFKSEEDGNKSYTMPPEALFYALPYMSLRDILNMERVCKALRDWVRTDVLLWRSLHVEPPLSEGFTDEILIQLTSRSKGQLECLNLVNCLRITEGVVEHVVLASPKLSKLFLPGCSRITAEGIMLMVKAHTDHKLVGMPGLKQLKLWNINGLTRDHVESLLAIMGVSKVAHSGLLKPQYYHNGYHTLPCDDQRPIDVEVCPKCSNVRLVYDCTRKRCRHGQECRACILCILRCVECGICTEDNQYEDTFCLDYVCFNCWLKLRKCAECNRPACSLHASQFIQTGETTFVCSDCFGSSPGAGGLEFDL